MPTDCSNHLNTSSCHFKLLPAFITQWFSSGKITKRVGTPSLFPEHGGVGTNTKESKPRGGYALLQRVPYRDAVGLGQAVIFVPVDDKLGRRPFVHRVRGAIPVNVFRRQIRAGRSEAHVYVLARHGKGFLLPGSCSPFVVELARHEKGTDIKRRDGCVRKRVRRSHNLCTWYRNPRMVSETTPSNSMGTKRKGHTPSWHTKALNPKPNSGFP